METKTLLPNSYSNNITTELHSKSGVYTMYSIPSDKFYIGSNTLFDTRLGRFIIII